MNGSTVMLYVGIGAVGGGLGALDPPWWAFLLFIGGLVCFVKGVMNQ